MLVDNHQKIYSFAFRYYR